MKGDSGTTTRVPGGRELRVQLLMGAPVTERTIEVAGVSTAVVEAGSGPPIVLLHGQGNFGPVFLPVMQPLADGHRLVVPDLPASVHRRCPIATRTAPR